MIPAVARAFAKIRADRAQDRSGPSPASLAMLGALQGRQQYTGTVPPHVVARRRAANKVARRSRRINRMRAR